MQSTVTLNGVELIVTYKYDYPEAETGYKGGISILKAEVNNIDILPILHYKYVDDIVEML